MTNLDFNENELILLNIALDKLYKETFSRHMKAQISLLRDKVNGRRPA